jgi:hypothetical protein
MYKITNVMKAGTDNTTSITACPAGIAAISVIRYLQTFTTEVIVLPATS